MHLFVSAGIVVKIYLDGREFVSTNANVTDGRAMWDTPQKVGRDPNTGTKTWRD